MICDEAANELVRLWHNLCVTENEVRTANARARDKDTETERLQGASDRATGQERPGMNRWRTRSDMLCHPKTKGTQLPRPHPNLRHNLPRRREEALPKVVRDIGWKAQVRPARISLVCEISETQGNADRRAFEAGAERYRRAAFPVEARSAAGALSVHVRCRGPPPDRFPPPWSRRGNRRLLHRPPSARLRLLLGRSRKADGGSCSPSSSDGLVVTRPGFSALPPLFCHTVVALFPFDRGEQETRDLRLKWGERIMRAGIFSGLLRACTFALLLAGLLPSVGGDGSVATTEAHAHGSGGGGGGRGGGSGGGGGSGSGASGGGADTVLQSAQLAPAPEGRAPQWSGPLEPAPRPPAPIPTGLAAPREAAAHTVAHHRRTLAVPTPRPRPAQLTPGHIAPNRALSLIPD